MRICTEPRCGSTKNVKRNRLLNKDICLKCYKTIYRPKENCVLCGNIRHVAFREADGGAVCVDCNGRPRKHCAICAKFRPVATHREDGKPVCGGCYRKFPERQATCIGCGRVKYIAGRREDGEPLCPTCIKRDPKYLKVCVLCQKLAVPKISTPQGPIGDCCYRGVPGRYGDCSGCGRNKPVMGRRVDGGPLCVSCVKTDPGHMKKCVLCGNPSAGAKRTPEGLVGLCCYPNLPGRKADCAVCGNFRAICGRTDDGKPLCDKDARVVRAQRKLKAKSTFACVPL